MMEERPTVSGGKNHFQVKATVYRSRSEGQSCLKPHCDTEMAFVSTKGISSIPATCHDDGFIPILYLTGRKDVKNTGETFL